MASPPLLPSSGLSSLLLVILSYKMQNTFFFKYLYLFRLWWFVLVIDIFALVYSFNH